MAWRASKPAGKGWGVAVGDLHVFASTFTRSVLESYSRPVKETESRMKIPAVSSD